MKKNHTPMMTRNGSHELSSTPQNGLPSGSRAVICTPRSSSRLMTSAPCGSTVSNLLPSRSTPETTSLVIVTDCTLPASTSCTNWL